MPTPPNSSPPAAPHGAVPHARAVVRGATVLASSGPVVDGEVVMEGGVIVEVTAARGPVPDVVLVPGFVDLQVNGIGALDVARTTGGDWEALDRALLAQGVTTWCPTLVSAPLDALEASLETIGRARGRPSGGRPEIAGVHLEGPFLAVAGAHRPSHLRNEVDLSWLGIVAPASDDGLVRVVTLAPELPGALDAIAALGEAGVLVSLGHSACSAEVAVAATDAGARLVTHLGNAMGPLHHRAPGLLGAALADDRLSVSIIADLVHTHPVFVRMAFAAKGARRMALVTDAVAVGSGRPGPGPPRLEDGTLAGSVLTMDGALSNVVRRSSVPLADAVEAASTTPARLLGLHDRGVLAPGRRADLVALEAAGDDVWRVATVWVAGNEVWKRPDPVVS